MGVPTMMYQSKDGEVVFEIFDSDEIPKGWVDDPSKCRPRKSKEVKDANSDPAD